MAGSKRKSGDRLDHRSLAFNNVKNQIAYCGLWCGSCRVGNGTLNELAKDCRTTIMDYGVDDWGPKTVDYEKLLEGLSTVASMKPCVGCIKGGGKEDCVIRACARRKGFAECAECGKEKSCENAKMIRHMHSGALGVGMKVKKTSGSRSRQLEKWLAECDGD